MKTHKSHITSSEAKSRGWSRVPSPAIQRETKQQEVGIEYMSGNYITLPATNSVDCYTTSRTTTDSGILTTDSTTYYPYTTWGDLWVGDSDDADRFAARAAIREIIKEEVTMDKRTLFKVYVVDPKKNGKVLLDGKLVIAVNENQAMLKAGVADIAEGVGLDLEQVDVYVQTIGTFIRPRKETQRVKITKDEED